MSAGRTDRLQSLLAERELETLLVTDLTNVRYVTGFGGTNGLCVASRDQRLFLTDFRYTERARAELRDGWELGPAERDLLPAAAKLLRGRVGFDDAKLSVRAHKRLTDAAPEGVELVPAGGMVEQLRRAKDDVELRAIAEAAKLADRVYKSIEEEGLRGRAEFEVAHAAEARIRELGAEPSFPVIVAAGPNGALPHAEPSQREIGEGELVIVDMGAIVDGYCSDCTRTYASGEIAANARDVYELVRSAQAAALDAVRADVTCVDADAAARKPIEAAGHGERFGHGTGHGVGLEVHEAPTLSPRSEDTLAANDVVTVEPGVYVTGGFGVRIEDLVVVTDDGHRNLSGRPKELTVVN